MAPNIHISESALVALRMLIGQSRDFVPVVNVDWSLARSAMWADEFGREVFRDDGPGWDVGIYDRASIRPDQICMICGVEFVFGQGAISMRLDGALLDYRNGKFVVENAAA